MCLSDCVSVGPAFTAYTSLTFGRILIKLCENVETLVGLIVLKFHKNRFSVDMIVTSFLFLKHISKGNNSAQRTTTLPRETIMLRQTVTLATAIFFLLLSLLLLLLLLLLSLLVIVSYKYGFLHPSTAILEAELPPLEITLKNRNDVTITSNLNRFL